MIIGSNQILREIPLDEFDRMVQINLRAPFLLVKGVVEGMKAQHWGRIIFISSIAAYGAGINGAREYQLSRLNFPHIDTVEQIMQLPKAVR